jgi:hypothetical protein
LFIDDACRKNASRKKRRPPVKAAGSFLRAPLA